MTSLEGYFQSKYDYQKSNNLTAMYKKKVQSGYFNIMGNRGQQGDLRGILGEIIFGELFRNIVPEGYGVTMSNLDEDNNGVDFWVLDSEGERFLSIDIKTRSALNESRSKILDVHQDEFFKRTLRKSNESDVPIIILYLDGEILNLSRLLDRLVVNGEHLNFSEDLKEFWKIFSNCQNSLLYQFYHKYTRACHYLELSEQRRFSDEYIGNLNKSKVFLEGILSNLLV
ncbi:MAG TPA: hypothetical protein VGA67_01295 [Candidatus Dojkabacteria bacterium]|jgi:hypothetical protein